MKKSSLFLGILLSFAFVGRAQVVTPGTGHAYTFSELAELYPAAVTADSAGNAHLLQDLTLSAGDTLLIDGSLQRLELHNTLTITVSGAFVCTDRTDTLVVAAHLDNASTEPYELRFEEAPASTLQQIRFENGKDIFLSHSDVAFVRCEFTGFAEAAVRMMNCNPRIVACDFHDNRAAAVNSPANASASPQILDCRFYNNVLSNANTPQINLGTGAADTIVIQGNSIEGVASDMSGGIAISNLMGASDVTCAVVRGNRILHNRYGYTQNGTNIRVLIEENDILDNNLETNPMNGGSGISIYGNDTTCYARIRNNTIAGNLWGVTAIYRYSIDMGTADDWGYNVLYDNGNGGETHAFSMSQYSTLDATAVGNYWGANDSSFAESVILHQADNPSLGRVEFLPIMPLEPAFLGFMDIYDGDTLYLPAADSMPGIYYLYDEEYEPDVWLYFDPWAFDSDVFEHTENCEIIPIVTRGVTYEVVSDGYEWTEPIGYVRTVNFRFSVPHGDTLLIHFRIYVTSCGVEETTPPSLRIYPNPVMGNHFTVDGWSDGAADVTVYDANGRMVCRRGNVLPGSTVAVHSWRPGIYFVQIRQGNAQWTEKVMVR
jgi:hypothetical protein